MFSWLRPRLQRAPPIPGTTERICPSNSLQTSLSCAAGPGSQCPNKGFWAFKVLETSCEQQHPSDTAYYLFQGALSRCFSHQCQNLRQSLLCWCHFVKTGESRGFAEDGPEGRASGGVCRGRAAPQWLLTARMAGPLGDLPSHFSHWQTEEPVSKHW